ncbi:MAG: ABC transporter substrate-binding protein, partial [Bacteroidales bacterium]|nr:ABC transporter substrate-binding protein [Bacteroidales bacterium]
MNSLHNSILCFLAFLLLPSSCITENKKSCLPGISEVSVARYAERFSLKRTDTCTILTITDPWQGASGIRHVYYLVRNGDNFRTGSDSSGIIRVPVRNMICMSSTHLAMIAALGEQRTVSAVSGRKYIYDSILRSMADSGLIGETGYDTGLNHELILKSDPDLIMLYGIGSESAGYMNRISGAGIKMMYNADYLETNPLGRAEWIKVFGALYCREELADSIFNAAASAYNEIKSKIRAVNLERPDVLLGLPYRDTWYISPGNSYISTLIYDAGGNYLWGGTSSPVSLPQSFETVYLKALKADFWLNPGAANSRNEISSFDKRLEKLPCFISGNIYNNIARITAFLFRRWWLRWCQTGWPGCGRASRRR